MTIGGFWRLLHPGKLLLEPAPSQVSRGELCEPSQGPLVLTVNWQSLRGVSRSCAQAQDAGDPRAGGSMSVWLHPARSAPTGPPSPRERRDWPQITDPGLGFPAEGQHAARRGSEGDGKGGCLTPIPPTASQGPAGVPRPSHGSLDLLSVTGFHIYLSVHLFAGFTFIEAGSQQGKGPPLSCSWDTPVPRTDPSTEQGLRASSPAMPPPPPPSSRPSPSPSQLRQHVTHAEPQPRAVPRAPCGPARRVQAPVHRRGP